MNYNIPLLFVIYINDLPDNLTHHIKLYADDSKIIGVIKSPSDLESIQLDIDRAVEWSQRWLMRFNLSKCKVMHVGRSNNKSTQDYTMQDSTGARHTLEVTSVERDLGVLISNDLKLRPQVEAAASKANQMLGMYKKAFRSRGLYLWKVLFTTYIRPHLEFAVQAWSPHLLGDIDILERVQQRATKTITSLRRLPYESRLKRLGLTKLVHRRERGDLIQQFKFSHGIDDINFSVPQIPVPSQGIYQMRGNSMRLERQDVRNCEERNEFFTNRVVSRWNVLPESAVKAPNVNCFKNQVDLIPPFLK